MHLDRDGGAAAGRSRRSRGPRYAEPDRRQDLVPACFAIDEDRLAIPIDSVKPKGSTALGRIRNLERDPRASLLVEHWDPADWTAAVVGAAPAGPDRASRPSASRGLERASRALPAVPGRSVHRLLTFRIEKVGGWEAATRPRRVSSRSRPARAPTWTACQQYRATVERWGRKRSPSACSAFGLIISGSAMDQRPAVAHAEVVDGPDVGPLQLEQQEHLGRPAADAADRDEPGDDLLVVERVDAAERHGAVADPGREVDQRQGLVVRTGRRARSASSDVARIASGVTVPPIAATNRP